jgi:uncharacterized protein YbjT (DUF2867 family)
MILVVGGTGLLGARVVEVLVQSGQSVRCLVRPGTADDALQELGVEVVRGDLTEPTTLPAACAGVDTVVTTATMIARRLAGAKRPSIYEVDQAGTAALVAVAEAAGVQRFVYLSYAGVDQSLSSPMSRAKLNSERVLGTSGMRSVIVRPDPYQEVHLGPPGRFDIAAGSVAVFGEGNNPLRWVAVQDVARLVAAVAVEDDPPAMVEFGGPEPLTRNEAILVAEKFTGRQIKRLKLPRPVVKLGLRLLERPNDALASIFGLGLHMDLVHGSWSDAPLRDRGIDPRSATEWLKQQAEATAGVDGASG